MARDSRGDRGRGRHLRRDPTASAAGHGRLRLAAPGVLITASLVGLGASLNVAVAGSLVLYRLAGLV
jgi:hypothetical protein